MAMTATELLSIHNGANRVQTVYRQPVNETVDMKIFQALIQAGTQVSTGTLADITNYISPTITDPETFTFNAVTGVLTILKDGVYEVSGHVVGTTTGNNRTQGYLSLQHDTGSGYAEIWHDKQYMIRNTVQNQGSVQFNGFYVECSALDTLKLQANDDGIAYTMVKVQFTVKRVR